MPRTDPPETTDKRSDSQFGFWLGTAALVLVIYPLSTGPVLRLADACGLDWISVARIYTPLGALTQHSSAAQEFLQWYVFDLWGVPVPMFPK